ncbi:MAG: hypothetical protein PHG05_03955 [Candidatus Nanoarchaeia archaeon]|nr:hypothetical protein [Candidatus Nanoarchaeia archaeon]
MRWLVAILFILVLSGVTIAADIDTAYTLLDKDVAPGDEAVFELEIINNEDREIRLMIFADEFAFMPFSEVFENMRAQPNEIVLSGKQTQKVKVLARIREDAVPGDTYKTLVKIKDANDLTIKAKQEIDLEVIKPEKLVKIEADFPDELIAKKNFRFNLKLIDKYNIDLNNVEVEIKSDIFEKKFSTDLIYNKPFSNEVSLDISPITDAGGYLLLIKTYYDGEIVGDYSKRFVVIKNPDIKEKVEKNSRFLIEEAKLIKSNEGNLDQQESLYYQLDWFEKIFTTYSIKPTQKQSNYVVWDFVLRPGDSYEVDVKTDYRGACITILILILFGILGIYFFGKKVAVRKEVFRVKNEGGISELKVMLHVKNRGKDLSNVEVIDFLPSLIKPIKGHYTTLEPSKIQRGSLGLRVIWILNNLKSGEERIITYRVESHLKILGKLHLPSAIVKYKFMGKLLKVRSNKVVFF